MIANFNRKEHTVLSIEKIAATIIAPMALSPISTPRSRVGIGGLVALAAVVGLATGCVEMDSGAWDDELETSADDTKEYEEQDKSLTYILGSGTQLPGSGWCTGTNERYYSGDFDGDGRTDALCFTAYTGVKHIEYNMNDGGDVFDNVSEWSSNLNWCIGATEKLMLGDFNGDGRTDLMCFKPSTGKKWFDYASQTGTFGGTDFETGEDWCGVPSVDTLHIGDFNGDNRKDLLCFNSAGFKYIDYADANGHFAGTDWQNLNGWCGQASTDRIVVGDYNGDRRDDILCHNRVNGNRYVDHADPYGHFGNTDWYYTNDAFCTHDANADLRAADFNGDNRDDLLCSGPDNNGFFWIDIAGTLGELDSINAQNVFAWCAHAGAVTSYGDFNGDSQTDLLCRDSAGVRWVLESHSYSND